MRKLKTRLRADEGMTLIELLIAMTILSIGIAALVAGFSSGVVAINHSRLTSTAGSLADQQMELYRQASFASLPAAVPPIVTTSTPNGPDGHTYWMQVTGTWTCAVGTYSPGPPPSCSGTPASRPVKSVTINVRDGSASARLLFSETTTFDSSTS
jgi:prepilin-type N-terminal cleavage/methylation domain-containing protein